MSEPSLSDERLRQFQRYGYCSPLPVLTASAAREAVNEIELYESQTGRPLEFPEASKSYLLFSWADQLVHHPHILDAVQTVIGADILVYNTTMWIKEPQTPAVVPWHRDGAYLFLQPKHHVTAWVALSTSNIGSGCVRVLAGSHTDAESHGRQTPDHVDRSAHGDRTGLKRSTLVTEVAMELAPGEMSLHHANVLHCSRGNDANHRRMGFAISYVAAHVRQLGEPRASALLVRGEDRCGNFPLEARLQTPQSACARAAHSSAVQRFAAREDAAMNAHRMLW